MSFLENMFLNAVAIGFGFFAPLENLSTICPTGQELRIICELPTFPTLEVTNFKVLNFTDNEFRIDAFQITEGAKFRVYKKVYLNLGVGGYYVRKISNSGFESTCGSCSYLGFHIPFEFGPNKTIIPEISYYSVPRGLSFTLNIGITL